MSKLVTIEFREIDLPAQFADAQANYFAQLLQVGCFGECNATSSEVAATAARLQARWSAAGKTVLLVNASSLDGVNNVLPSASWMLHGSRLLVRATRISLRDSTKSL